MHEHCKLSHRKAGPKCKLHAVSQGIEVQLSGPLSEPMGMDVWQNKQSLHMQYSTTSSAPFCNALSSASDTAHDGAYTLLLKSRQQLKGTFTICMTLDEQGYFCSPIV